jgi:hypothetical protein
MLSVYCSGVLLQRDRGPVWAREQTLKQCEDKEKV